MKIYLCLTLIFFVLLNTFGCSSEKAPQSPSVSSHVALISEVEDNVFHKKNKTFEWLESSAMQKLDNFDSVKTTDNSSAVLSFLDGGIINVEENSIILVLERKLQQDGHRQNLALSQGKLEGVLEADKKEFGFLVKTPNGWVKADNKNGKTHVNVEVTKNITKVKAIKGNVSVQILNNKKKIEKKIEKGQEVSITRPTKSKLDDFIHEQVEASIDQKSLPKKVSNTFEITYPNKKILTSKEQKVTFQGSLTGSVQVFINGQKITAHKNTFKIDKKLEPGLNVFTFQTIDNGKITYHVYKVTRI